MKRITILIPDGETSSSTVASVIGAYEILTEANAELKRKGSRRTHRVEIGGASSTVSCNAGLVAITPHCDVSAIKASDLIIIPSSSIRSFETATPGNQRLMRWIAQQYHAGAEVASICSGAFMLAASGIMNGKACSTHWAHADAFSRQFPDVALRRDKLITDEHGICTNGGAYSFLHLMIYLVEKYYDRETAIYSSKIFQIDIDRESQSPFAIFSTQKTHDDEVVRKAQLYIESHLDERISVEDLAARFAVGRRHFDRRFIRATGNSPLEYVQRVKIESAKKALETGRKNVQEAMYGAGYNDEKAFRDVFRKCTGLSPLEYRKRYQKSGSA